jgi:hypothetical protein
VYRIFHVIGPIQTSKTIEFQLGGKRYRLSHDDVCNRVAFVPPRPTEKYFITINERPYPPKQVLELALRIPSANFTTAAANAILSRLGFEVQTAVTQEVQSKTESERLFESYLHASGYLEFEFEPQISNASARPDFVLKTNVSETPMVLFEIKEFQPTPADFKLGYGFYDPYGAIRDKIQEARKKFRDYKEYPCALVLYNAGRALVDLRWEFIYGAMLGNLGYSIPFDKAAGRLVDKAVLSPVFTQGGEMHREKNGQVIETQNTTISAILVIELLPVGKRRFEIETAKKSKKLGRELGYEEYIQLIDSSRGTERDVSLRQLRSVTCRNPYSRIAFPDNLFRGPYDECYGEVSGELQRVYAGQQLKEIEDAQREVGIKQHMILPKDALP